ncbi:Gustatory receptor 72a [Halyomorpha halys]|nr:Gustatory receptor 72a [Halyomorpha halys]
MQQPPIRTVESEVIFRISSIMGLFPFRNIDNALMFDWFLLFYSLFAVVVSLSLISVYIRIFFSFPEWLPAFLITCALIANHLIGPIYLLCLWINRDLVAETFQCLNTLKLYFNELILDNSTKRILFDIFFPLFINIIQFCSGYTSYSILESTISTLTGLILSVSFGQFRFLVDTIGDMLDSAINLLKDSVFSKNLRNVKEIVEVVNQLISTSDNINYIYSFPMLMSMSISFVYVIVQLFLIFHLIHSNEFIFVDFFGLLLVMMLVFSIIWRVSHSSALTYYKSKEFNAVLYQIMLDEENKEIRQNNKLQLHISMNREVVFTAYGFFNLDHTLIYSMVASATTYVVILIQFGQPLEKPPKAAITNLTITPLPLSMTTSI